MSGAKHTVFADWYGRRYHQPGWYACRCCKQDLTLQVARYQIAPEDSGFASFVYVCRECYEFWADWAPSQVHDDLGSPLDELHSLEGEPEDPGPEGGGSTRA